MQVGIFSVGDISPDPSSGVVPSEEDRLFGLARIAERAEAAGLDVFAVGEHHAPGHVPSSPAVLLAYVAARTRRIMLSTSATVLSVNDPVRVAEDYATVQLLAGGRFDLMAGRGYEPTMFSSFGFPAEASHDILTENVALLTKLWSQREVDWSGNWRGGLSGFTSTPRPRRGESPFVWLASTNSERTARLAAASGCGLFVNNIFQTYSWYSSLVEAYRESLADPCECVIGVGAHVFMQRRSQDAVSFFRPYFDAHPIFGSVPLEQYCDNTALAVGSPAEIVDKTLKYREVYGHYQRQLFLVDFAGLPLDVVFQQIDFLGEIADELRSEFDRLRPSGAVDDPPRSRASESPSVRIGSDRD